MSVPPSAPSLAWGKGQTGSSQPVPGRDADVGHATWGHLGEGSSLERAGLQREADHGTWRKSKGLCNEHEYSQPFRPPSPSPVQVKTPLVRNCQRASFCQHGIQPASRALKLALEAWMTTCTSRAHQLKLMASAQRCSSPSCVTLLSKSQILRDFAHFEAGWFAPSRQRLKHFTTQ